MSPRNYDDLRHDYAFIVETPDWLETIRDRLTAGKMFGTEKYFSAQWLSSAFSEVRIAARTYECVLTRLVRHRWIRPMQPRRFHHRLAHALRSNNVCMFLLVLDELVIIMRNLVIFGVLSPIRDLLLEEGELSDAETVVA